MPVVGDNGRGKKGEGGMGIKSCELGILWSNLVRKLCNDKHMGDPRRIQIFSC